ncbi:unnamed protein product [Ixodes pacificus]
MLARLKPSVMCWAGTWHGQNGTTCFQPPYLTREAGVANIGYRTNLYEHSLAFSEHPLRIRRRAEDVRHEHDVEMAVGDVPHVFGAPLDPPLHRHVGVPLQLRAKVGSKLRVGVQGPVLHLPLHVLQVGSGTSADLQDPQGAFLPQGGIVREQLVQLAHCRATHSCELGVEQQQ